MTTACRDERGCRVAISSLSGIGPARLSTLLRAFPSARATLCAIARGAAGDLDLRLPPARRDEILAAWRREAAAVDPEALLARHEQAGLVVLIPGDDDWPDCFVLDPAPPEVLFVRGRVPFPAGPAVAVVGTRRCTALGAQVAHDLGRDLAAAGISVVSGLARGIDGAAHRGALVGGARPVGVVATGLDVVYPATHRQLWAAVGEAGALVSEFCLGTRPDRWRFPARNRLIAALAQVVVVVESRAAGGAMRTADAALDRDRLVMAVPGSVRAATAQGPNRLLHDGLTPVRDVIDVLVALGLSARLRQPAQAPRAELPEPDRLVHDLLGFDPVSLETLVAASGLAPCTVASALARLELSGLVSTAAGGYLRSPR